MGFNLFLVSVLAVLPLTSSSETIRATVTINGTKTVSVTDDNFICATLDWWPPEKCNYDQCPWGYASIINLDLSQPLLAKAILALKPLRIRIGGSLQDQVIYNVGDLEEPCNPFKKIENGLFGFSKGCLEMQRWEELNDFLSRTGAIVTFGLNALHGRHKLDGIAWGGAWDSTNARDFINYTVSKGYQIDSWEFGNELSGSGIGASVDAELYGKDLINLKEIVNDLYRNSQSKPLIVAPGGFYEKQWFSKLLQVSGPGVVDVVTHHMYNLGPGNDPKLMEKILNPGYLNSISSTFDNLNRTIESFGPWASAWVGESGGAYNSGGRRVSDAFVDSFWYLDQLGMSSRHNTKVYCRQSLIGGNYGLIDKNTFIPNPDFYSALLWHRLMGNAVLAVKVEDSPFLRAYAHCSKARAGVTLLLINLSKQTAFAIEVGNGMNLILNPNAKHKNSFLNNVKKMVSWVGKRASDGYLFREEYHLTPKDGDLQSQTMVLNGKPLKVSVKGDIPEIEPVRVNVKSPIYVAPTSISFIVLPNFDAPACDVKK